MTLSSRDTLTTLFFQTHEHGMSFYLFVSALILSSVLYGFQCISHLPPWLSLFVSILFFLMILKMELFS